jgi:hypothetical protein
VVLVSAHGLVQQRGKASVTGRFGARRIIMALSALAACCGLPHLPKNKREWFLNTVQVCCLAIVANHAV